MEINRIVPNMVLGLIGETFLSALAILSVNLIVRFFEERLLPKIRKEQKED